MFQGHRVLAKPTRTGKQRWRFRAFAPLAQRAFLVQEKDAGSNAWLPMTRDPDCPQIWNCDVALRPGAYRFRYYTDDGRTFLNCGDNGLTSTALPAEPALTLTDPPRLAATA
ncbi:MAG: hypothetical protein AAF288_02130 [Planctomycetota bacterium]